MGLVTSARSGHVLGLTKREFERLVRQARLIDPITRRFFIDAGIEPGMRVLDVGSGAGDVTFLAAELVGASGEVVGVDRSAAALATASDRARSRSLPNVSFREGNPAQMKFERPFDAAVGRYVLEMQPDPAAMLRGLAAHVRPGGVIVFHELDFGTESSYPPAPTHDRCVSWWTRLLPLTGADPRIGIRLHSIFVAANLPAPSLGLEAIIAGGEACAEYLRSLADLIGSVIDDLERHGIATAAEIGCETLATRMLDEVKVNGCVVVGRAEICAWTRK